MSLEMLGRRRARVPSFHRVGRADRRSRGRDQRADRGARGGRGAIPWGALSRTNFAGSVDGRGSHLHDGSDDDALADEGGGGECGDHC